MAAPERGTPHHAHAALPARGGAVGGPHLHRQDDADQGEGAHDARGDATDAEEFMSAVVAVPVGREQAANRRRIREVLVAQLHE